MREKISDGFLNILVIIMVIAVLFLVGFAFFLLKKVNSAKTVQPSASTQITPAMKVTDMSPELSNDQKTAVVIMHSDSSREEIIMANSLVDSYVKSLDSDTKVVSETPLK
jgi:hypothetical protein